MRLAVTSKPFDVMLPEDAKRPDLAYNAHFKGILFTDSAPSLNAKGRSLPLYFSAFSYVAC